MIVTTASCMATANSDVTNAFVPPTVASPDWIFIEPVEIPQAHYTQNQGPDDKERAANMIREVGSEHCSEPPSARANGGTHRSPRSATAGRKSLPLLRSGLGARPRGRDPLLVPPSLTGLDGNEIGVFEGRCHLHESLGRIPLRLVHAHPVTPFNQVCLGDAAVGIGQKLYGIGRPKSSLRESCRRSPFWPRSASYKRLSDRGG